MPSDPSPIWTVEWFGSARELSADLWAAAFGPPVEGLWWYRALEDSGLGEQFEFHYALLKKNGTPAGIAPAFVFNVPIDLVAPPLIARALRQVGRVIARRAVPADAVRGLAVLGRRHGRPDRPE